MKSVIFAILIIIEIVTAFDYDKIYSVTGCDKMLVHKSLNDTSVCIKTELADVMQLLTQNSGDTDPIKSLQNYIVREMIIPALGSDVCKKRENIFKCTAGLRNISCSNILPNVLIKIILDSLAKPISNLFCKDIVSKKKGVPDLLNCGISLAVNHKEKIMACKPGSFSGVKNIEGACSVIGASIQCVKGIMDKVCSLKINKAIYSIVNVIEDVIGCSFESQPVVSLPSTSNSSEILTDREPHVNINHFVRSSANQLFISSNLFFILLILSNVFYYMNALN